MQQNPFGLDSILQQYKASQLGGAPTIGNPQAMQEEQAKQDGFLQMLAQAGEGLSSQSGIDMQGAGVANVLAEALGAYADRKASDRMKMAAEQGGNAERANRWGWELKP